MLALGFEKMERGALSLNKVWNNMPFNPCTLNYTGIDSNIWRILEDSDIIHAYYGHG